MKKNIKYAICIMLLTMILTGCGCSKSKKIDISKTKEVKIENLKLNIPEVFEEEKTNYDYGDYDNIKKYYLLLDDKTFEQCNFSVLSSKDNGKSLSYYIDDILGNNLDDLSYINENNEEKTYNIKNINGNEWLYHEYEDGLNKFHYIYVTNKNNKVYTIVFNSIGNKDICNKAYDKILNSFTFY